MVYRLGKTAKDGIEAILRESAISHGLAAADRYSLLIGITITAALGDDPELPGSRPIARVPGIRAYPTRLSRMKIEPARRVRKPRHLVLYRVGFDGVVEILGLVHDRMVLSRAARKIAQSFDP